MPLCCRRIDLPHRHQFSMMKHDKCLIRPEGTDWCNMWEPCVAPLWSVGRQHSLWSAWNQLEVLATTTRVKLCEVSVTHGFLIIWQVISDLRPPNEMIVASQDSFGTNSRKSPDDSYRAHILEQYIALCRKRRSDRSNGGGSCKGAGNQSR